MSTLQSEKAFPVKNNAAGFEKTAPTQSDQIASGLFSAMLRMIKTVNR